MHKKLTNFLLKIKFSNLFIVINSLCSGLFIYNWMFNTNCCGQCLDRASSEFVKSESVIADKSSTDSLRARIVEILNYLDKDRRKRSVAYRGGFKDQVSNVMYYNLYF